MTATEWLIDAPDSHRPDTRGYRLSLATSADEVRAARVLRDGVFADENYGTTTDPAGNDRDDVDDRCDHLIVWYCGNVRSPVRVGERKTAVATIRLLPPHRNDAAPRGAGLGANRIFGLMPLESLLDSTVEVGGACVHADHRTGTAASLLWGGVARYLHLTGYRYAIGCAPVDLRDGGSTAAAFWDLVRQRHLAPAERRCRARIPVPIGGVQRADAPVVPPMLPGCLRWGATICGPPAANEMYCTAEFLVLLDLQGADRRYLRRFLGVGGRDEPGSPRGGPRRGVR